MKLFRRAPDGTIRVSLWHSPYNGGWIWIDRKQWKRFSCGWRKPKLWWCLGGFCGSITIQSVPWGKDPGERARQTVRNATEGKEAP
jgi:hypothetical protein